MAAREATDVPLQVREFCANAQRARFDDWFGRSHRMHARTIQSKAGNQPGESLDGR